MFTGLVIRSILRPAVFPSHGVQILPAQTAINKADDVSQHDRTPLVDRVQSERILVSGWLRRFRKMASSDIPVYPARSRAPPGEPCGGRDRPAHLSLQIPDSPAAFLDSWRGHGRRPPPHERRLTPAGSGGQTEA